MNKKGFTLIEIMATIAILSILAVIGTVSVSKMLQKSREKAMVIQENSLVESASMFIEDYCNNPIGNYQKEKCKELYTKSGYEKGNEIEKYVCISDLKQEGYFDEKLNFHTSPCTGFIIQKIDSKTNKIKTSKTYVQCKNEKNEIVYASKMGEDFNIYNYTKCPGIYYGRYHIVYDKNTGTGNIPKTTCVYEKPCNITSEQYTKNKYLFTGWNTKADGSGKSYSNGEEVSKLVAIDEGEFKLYAQYSAKIYTVKYDGNGATSGNMVDTQYAFDEKKALPQNTYQKTGYTFKGWSRTQNSEYIEFEDKEEIEGLAQEHREQITLYAVWEANKYTLTFEANGGSLAQTTKTVTYDSQYGSLPTPSKAGYTFLGWYKGSLSTLNLSNLSGLLSATYIKEDDIVKITEDTTLTAIYWANTLHIIYNVSTADSISSPVTATDGTIYYWKINANKNIERSTDNSTYNEKFFKKLYNETVDLINYNYDKYLNVIKSGYKLVDGKEWCTGQNGAGTCFDQTKEYTPSEICSTINTGNCEITLYTNWTPIKYTVAFNANGGSGSMDSTQHTYDTALALSTNTFSRTGYVFDGWNTNSGGTGTSYVNGDSVKNLSSINGSTVTLYAKWTPIKYNVAFNANGGSGTMSNIELTYDTPTALTSNAFTRLGYAFDGWNTNSAGTGTSYVNGDSVKNLSSINGSTVTLYAKWKQTKITYAQISQSFSCSNDSAGSSPYIFKYSGNCEIIKENTDDWKIKFTSNGSFTFNLDTNIDVFLVGGGGGSGSPIFNVYYNSSGGGGGYTKTIKNIKTSTSSNSVEIGSGGAGGHSGGATNQPGKTGGTTSAVVNGTTYSAAGGKGGNADSKYWGSYYLAYASVGGDGGSGGGGAACANTSCDNKGKGGNGGSYGSDGTINGGKGQGTTTCEFGEGTTSGCNAGKEAYAGGGAACTGTGSYTSCNAGSAGAGGGGKAGSAGTANTGGGGGGVKPAAAGSWNSDGKKGGSGIVIIRNTR